MDTRNLKRKGLFILSLALAAFWCGSLTGIARADDGPDNACAGLPSFSALRSALKSAQQQPNGGFAGAEEGADLGVGKAGEVVEHNGAVLLR